MKKRLLYKFGLEEFTSDLDEIKLTDNLIIKKFNQKDKEVFYGKIGDKWINEDYRKFLKYDYYLEFLTEVTVPMKPNDFDDDRKVITTFRVLFRLFKEGRIELRFFQKYISPMDEENYQSLGFSMLYSSYISHYEPYKIEKRK